MKRLNNRRRFARKPVTAFAEVLTPNGVIMDAEMRNISEGGALIALRKPSAVPRSFSIRIPGNVRVLRECRLAWQSEMLAGFEFVGRTGSGQNLFWFV